jgi:hypothetical protein
MTKLISTHNKSTLRSFLSAATMAQHYLPEELWLKIFQSLSVPDLCNVTLVYTQFYRIGSDPKLWENVKITPIIDIKTYTWEGLAWIENWKTSDVKDITETLGHPRFRNIKKLDLRFAPHFNNLEISSLLKHIKNNCPMLEEMSFGEYQLLSANQSLLGDIVSTLSHINMGFTRWDDKDQMEAVLLQINLNKIKTLDLSNVDLSDLSCVVLASLARHSSVLILESTDLTKEQVIAVLKSCLENDAIEQLNLFGIDMTHIMHLDLFNRVEEKLSDKFQYDDEEFGDHDVWDGNTVVGFSFTY